MSWDQLDHMLSKFNFGFNWEYRSNSELCSLLDDVFRILEDEDERSLEHILIGCVHQACPGLTLNQPQNDPDLPYEMKFVVHPPHEDFCIKKLLILSEARNLELYINGGYEKSSRGVMLTMNKGRKLSLFEAEFDLSSYTNSISNATIKFLSLPCKNKMKLQAVVMKVERCEPISRAIEQEAGTVDMASVKRYLGAVGRPLSEDAQKMLQSFETYQKSPVFKAQRLLLSQNVSVHCNEEPASQEAAKPNEEVQVKVEKDERQHCISSPEDDKPFMNMLAELYSKMSDDGKIPSETDAKPSSPQSRWAAYLQSRVRVSKKVSSGSLGKEKSRQRPNSVGCVDGGEVDRTVNFEIQQKKRLQEGQHFQCKACGCPGCLDVYNSVSTNVFAAEERIMERVDKKFAKLQEDINQKFESLVQLLSKRQEIDEKVGVD